MNQYLEYSEEQNYSVYKHTNLQTGKVYYGVSQSPVDRWNDGNGYSSNPLFWKDIIAYGWRNFKHEIIFKNLKKRRGCDFRRIADTRNRVLFTRKWLQSKF